MLGETGEIIIEERPDEEHKSPINSLEPSSMGRLVELVLEYHQRRPFDIANREMIKVWIDDLFKHIQDTDPSFWAQIRSNPVNVYSTITIIVLAVIGRVLSESAFKTASVPNSSPSQQEVASAPVPKEKVWMVKIKHAVIGYYGPFKSAAEADAH